MIDTWLLPYIFTFWTKKKKKWRPVCPKDNQTNYLRICPDVAYPGSGCGLTVVNIIKSYQDFWVEIFLLFVVSPGETSNSNSFCQIVMKTSKGEYVLCTLIHGVMFQQSLDLKLMPREKVTFSVQGPSKWKEIDFPPYPTSFCWLPVTSINFITLVVSTVLSWWYMKCGKAHSFKL